MKTPRQGSFPRGRKKEWSHVETGSCVRPLLRVDRGRRGPGGRACRGYHRDVNAIPNDHRLQQQRRVQVTPLSIQKFDTEGGSRVLDSVTLSFSAEVSNQFGMTFVNPATITDSVTGTGKTPTPPVVTLFEPDGVTPLITAQEPDTPSIVTKSK